MFFSAVVCDGLSENGPHRFIESDISSKCELFAAGVTLWEEVCH